MRAKWWYSTSVTRSACLLTSECPRSEVARQPPPHAHSIQYKAALPPGYVIAVALLAFRFLGQLITMFSPARYYKLKKNCIRILHHFISIIWNFLSAKNHNLIFNAFISMPRSLYRPGQPQRSSHASYAPAWLPLHALGSAVSAHREAALSCTLCYEIQWYLVKDTEVEASVKENIWTYETGSNA